LKRWKGLEFQKRNSNWTGKLDVINSFQQYHTLTTPENNSRGVMFVFHGRDFLKCMCHHISPLSIAEFDIVEVNTNLFGSDDDIVDFLESHMKRFLTKHHQFASVEHTDDQGLMWSPRYYQQGDHIKVSSANNNNARSFVNNNNNGATLGRTFQIVFYVAYPMKFAFENIFSRTSEILLSYSTSTSLVSSDTINTSSNLLLQSIVTAIILLQPEKSMNVDALKSNYLLVFNGSKNIDIIKGKLQKFNYNQTRLKWLKLFKDIDDIVSSEICIVEMNNDIMEFLADINIKLT